METLNQWQSSGQHFQFEAADGHQSIFFRSTFTGQEREKPALLLIHGFPTSSWDWARLWLPLSNHFQLVTLDMLGFGFSSKPQRAYSIFEQADIYESLLTHLGVSQYHILAHDYGDTVTQELISRHNNQTIRSVIFLNGGLFPETHHPALIQKILLSPIGKWVGKLSSYKSLQKNFAKICAKPISDTDLKGYWEQIQFNNGKAVLHLLIHYMNERKQNRERWVGALQQTSVPLGLINGTLDPISGAHMAERYKSIIPNPVVYELSDTGHYPQVESSEALLEFCLHFWSCQGVSNNTA